MTKITDLEAGTAAEQIPEKVNFTKTNTSLTDHLKMQLETV